MTSTTPTDENASADSGPLHDYIILGQDTIGNVHLYRTKDETVFILDAGGHPVDRVDLSGRPLHHYESFVENRRGWHDYHPHVPCEDDDPFYLLRVV